MPIGGSLTHPNPRIVMRRSLYLPACLIVTASLWAQGTIVSPPGFATQEGNNNSYQFVNYSAQRRQIGDGEMRGQKRSLTQVAWRYDYRLHNASTATGRKWTNVTLNLCDCDWLKMEATGGNTFTKNQLSTPVEVFNSSWSLPSYNSTPFTKPDAFRHKMPFKSPYAHSGTNDLLLDFVFLGGTMDNNVTWSGGTNRSYYLDGNNDTTTYTSPRTQYPTTSPNPGCQDTAWTSNRNAYTYINLYVRGATYSTLTSRDHAEVQFYTRYTAPNGFMITAIGFGAIANGANVGARCNLLYVNLNLPWLAFGWTANSSGNSPTTTTFLAPWNNGMANLPVVMQTAWADSKLNTFSLTMGMGTVLPPDKPRPWRQVCCYYWIPTNLTGYVSRGSYSLVPITEYSYK